MISQKENAEKVKFQLNESQTPTDDNADDELQNVPDNTNNYRRIIIVKILLIIVTITATVQNGFVPGYSAVLLPQLRSANESLHADEEMGSWIASTPAIASFLGAMFSGVLMDRVGRKLTLQIQNGIAVISWISITVCQTYVILLFGRFIGGFSSGIVLVAAPIFIAEVSDPNMRGMVSVLPAIGESFGILLIYILGATLHWRLVAGLSIIPPAISIFASTILPETPVWLVRHGHVDSAREACLWYRANNIVQAKEEVQQIITRREREKYQQKQNLEGVSFYSAQILKPFIIVNVLNILQTLTGWFQLIVYAVEIIAAIIGEHKNEFFTAVLTAGVRFVFTIITIFALAFMGRRTISIYSAFCCGLSASSLGLALYFNYKTNSYVLAGCLLLYIASAAVAFSTLTRVMIGEMFPAKARATVGSISMAITCISLFSFTKLFPLLKLLMGVDGLFMLFGVSSFVASIFMYYMLPETKGKTLNDIEDYFAQNSIIWTRRNKQLKNPPKT